MNVQRCPECAGKSKLVDRETVWNTEMRHKRVCTVCETRYVVTYSNPTITEITT